MKELRRKLNVFLFKNRDKGIPNLMLYIAIGNAIVLALSLFNGGSSLFSLLCFDKTLILQGQVWRLVTYVFTQSNDGILGLIFLYFFYTLGRHVELSMGTLRFNLFYFFGVILMDVFAMLFCPTMPAGAVITQTEYEYLINTVPLYMNMAWYLHLSLLLTFATTHPDSQFLILFVIPVRAWVMGLIYLLIVLASIFNLSYPVLYFPHNLFPLVALANYLLFMGKDLQNLLPLSWRVKLKRKKKASSAHQGPIPFHPSEKVQPDYSHRCTVCGRTNVTDPGLEFRYCSRCKGFHCYCIDHINNHTHIEE